MTDYPLSLQKAPITSEPFNDEQSQPERLTSLLMFRVESGEEFEVLSDYGHAHLGDLGIWPNDTCVITAGEARGLMEQLIERAAEEALL